jgi:hypothetical protein
VEEKWKCRAHGNCLRINDGTTKKHRDIKIKYGNVSYKKSEL